MKVCIIGGCGYIGSALYEFLQSKLRPRGESLHLFTIDLEWFGNNINFGNTKCDYKVIFPSLWKELDAIVLLAGLSSVGMCKDVFETFNRNVAAFVNLLSKLNPKTKLIYASSGSLYGDCGNTEPDETWDKYRPESWYDLSKKCIDMYAQLSGARYYGLRFGTVNGGSDNLRTDIMINKMFHDAKQTGQISLYNPNVYRPILGMNDLCRAVHTLIYSDGKSGIYNLASFSMPIGKIADRVSKCMKEKPKVVNLGEKPSYNFSMSVKKFEKEFNFQFKDTVESIVSSIEECYDHCNKANRECIPDLKQERIPT